MKALLILPLLIISLWTYGQKNISVEQIKKHVYTLASDSMKGRGTGTEGQKMAAAYIADEFTKAGLVPVAVNNNGNPFFQPFSIYSPGKTYAFASTDTTLPDRRLKSKMYLNGQQQTILYDENSLNNLFHFFYISAENSFNDRIRKVVKTPQKSSKTLCLYISTDNLKDVAATIEEQHRNNGISSFIIKVKENEFQRIITGLPEDRFLTGKEKGNTSFYQLGMLKSRKLKIPGEIAALYEFCQKNPGCEIMIAGKHMEKALFTDKTKNESFIRYSVCTQGLWTGVETENVCALLEGKSKDLIVVGAHYDHVGESARGIFYGADDNASGTAAVIEIAKEMAANAKQGKIPEKSVLFVTFTAEEEGLIGSESFLLNPPFPEREIDYMINMDMIGRWDKRHDTLTHFTYFLSFAGKKHKMKRAAKNSSVDVLQTNIIQSPDVVNRLLYRFGSDHHGFVRRGIPSSVLFTGLHDDYHKVTDTPDKIWYSNNTAIARVVCGIIYNLAGNK